MSINFSSTKHRCNFEGILTSAELGDIRDEKTLHTLQTDKPIDPVNFKRLEEEVFSSRVDLSLRLYGFDGSECDISDIENIPSLRHFYFDCLRSCKGYEVLGELPKLETLSVGVEDLTSFDFLKETTCKLKTLTLGSTKSARPDISGVARFSQLTDLTVCGHKKGFAAIEKLTELTDLCLYGCSNPDLSFFDRLKKLRSLDVSLGGAADLSDIALATNLRYLGLCWIRGIKNIDFISDISGLQRLILDRLKQVENLPNLTTLDKLKWITISDLTVFTKPPII